MTCQVGGFCGFIFLLHTEIESRQTLQNTSETVKYQNNLYKIMLKTLTWTDALKECQKENMQLVSITDPYQQAFLTVQAVLRNTSLWIGLSSHDVSFQSHCQDWVTECDIFYCMQHLSYQTKRNQRS